MKCTSFIALFVLLVFNCKAQDSVVIQKLKINEIAIVGTLPIIQLYNYSSNRDIVFSALKDDRVLVDLINAGYTDTSKASKLLRPIHPGFNAMGVGVRAVIYLNNIKNKFKIFVPISVSYESHNYITYYMGKQESKRLDTIYNSEETFYLDSASSKVTKFRFETQNLYLQTGFNIERGNQYFRFSTGLNIGLGISLKNNLYIKHREYSGIQPTNEDSKYYENTYGYSEDKIQKVKPIVNARFLLPFCMKLNLKKVKHIGIMGEISPGFEMNKIVKGDLLTRWMLFCSLGARYTF